MKFLLKALAFSSILLSISSVAAIDIPENIQASDISGTSLTLSWDPVDTAFGYHIYYSSTPGVEILSAQKKEYVLKIPLVIDDLNPDTKYYFLISAFDDKAEESIFSEEISFSTIGSVEPVIELNASQDFKLGGIQVLAQNQISLEFTAALQDDEDSQREFKVVEKDNELNIFYIDNSKIDPQDPTKVIVTLEDNLPVATEFTLTVIDILDINGRNIESGIESFENFYIDESLLGVIFEEETQTVDLQNDNQINSSTAEENDGNTQNEVTGESGENTSSNTGSENQNEATVIDPVTGQILDSSEIAIDMNSAGAEAKKLPVTGPEHLFTFILAMLFGLMAIMFKFKKS